MATEQQLRDDLDAMRRALERATKRIQRLRQERDRLAEREQKAISILTHAVDDIDGDDLLELCCRLEADCNSEHDRAMQAEAEVERLKAQPACGWVGDREYECHCQGGGEPCPTCGGRHGNHECAECSAPPQNDESPPA